MMKKILYLGLVLVLAGALVAYHFYGKIMKPVVQLTNESQFIYIPSNAELNDVANILFHEKILSDTSTFLWLAEKKNLAKHIYPGKYRISNGMSNNELINHLRSAKRETVNLVFNNIRTLEQLAGRISEQIEADSTSIINLLNNESYLADMGFSREEIPAIFIPNTYEFYWNTSAKKFIQRMHKEYKRFWTKERLAKAEALRLSTVEVSTLASIVDEETNKKDEMPRVSGVYLNRIHKGIALQADPTLKFALGDFSIKRVLNKHKKIDSPYNTYMYRGLPPGPIRMPSLACLNAVLNYEKHSYLYFCAKEDFSGYHVFAKSLRQHNQNARRYQRALNKARIYR